MRILVTGGAGYIGSHVVKACNSAGYQIRVLDNLSGGHREVVPTNQLIVGDLSDRDMICQVLAQEKTDLVIHLAGLIDVGESIRHPGKYYFNNVVSSLHLLEAMRITGVSRIVFASSAAVYGNSNGLPLKEDSSPNPVNPYGLTKYAVERAITDYATAYGLGAIVFRFFNAAGASSCATIGEGHKPESHLIPLMLQVPLGQRIEIEIFGDDYPTADGTCVRDYLHVEDIAHAHLLAIGKMEQGFSQVFNLGLGSGFSVKEVLSACETVTESTIPYKVTERRSGDPAILIADPAQAAAELGWRPEYRTLESIISSAWAWHVQHPNGFD